MTSTPITVIAERRGIKRPKKIVTPTGTFALKNLLGEGGFGCGSSYTHVRFAGTLDPHVWSRCVYEGMDLETGQLVAAKLELRPDNMLILPKVRVFLEWLEWIDGFGARGFRACLPEKVVAIKRG